MKKLALIALLFASFAAKAETVNYDCDYTFDGHEYNVLVKYNSFPTYLEIDGKKYMQPSTTVLKHKMRWQMFEGTAIIHDTFTGRLLINNNQIQNFKCEIFGA